MESKYREARLQFQQGFVEDPLHLAEAGYKDSTAYSDLNWKFRILTAEARVRKGQIVQSLEPLQPEPPPDSPPEIFWRRRLDQAFSLCLLNNYHQAEERFSQAEALGQNAAKDAELAYVRGRCELSKRDWKKAESYLRPILKSETISDSFLKMYVLLSLGWSARQDLRYEEAIDWYLQCLTLARSLGALPLEEHAMGNLGSLYAELQDFDNAKKNSEEAEKIASRLKILRDEQKLLIDIGFIEEARGQSGAAEESYKHALQLASNLGDKETAARCLQNLTELTLQQGKLERAEKYHKDGFDLGLSGDTLHLWQLEQAKIYDAHGDYAKAVLELRSLLQQVENEDQERGAIRYRLKWAIQARLARDYAAQNNNPEADNWFQRSIATVDEAAKRMQHEAFRTALRDNIPVYDGYVTFLIAQKKYAKALQVAQSGRARTLLLDEAKPTATRPVAENAKAWLAKIQSYLGRNRSVLLSYFATDKECYLWTVTANQLRLSPLGIRGPDLDNLIDSYEQEIQQHLPLASSPAAKKLYQILVQPGSDLAPRGSHVIVVADSKIYSINFETLVSSQGPEHYWIEDVELENASSIDLLITSPQKRVPAKGLLLIGAPAQADPHFVELPHAPEEMASVRKHFSPGNIMSFSGRDATPDSYMRNSPGRYKFIHLATHGTPNAIDPLQSAIILSPDKGGNFKLLARDIIDSKVRLNADLVTISACQGVGTQIQSLEGLIGLEWAFMRAGAHQVVAALWDQDDAVTPALMDDFYDQLMQGKSAAAALHHAKLSILHAGGFHASPYYWASLQLYTRS